MKERPVELLAAVGHLLYGDHWRTPFAHDIGMQYKTLTKILNGKSELHAGSPAIYRCLDLLIIESNRIQKEKQAVEDLRARISAMIEAETDATFSTNNSTSDQA